MPIQQWLAQTHVIAMMISVGVFLFVVAVATVVRFRWSVRRRIASIEAERSGQRSLARSEQQRLSRLRERAAIWLQPGSSERLSDIRKQLLQSGFFSPAAVAIFYALRLVCAVAFAVAVPITFQVLAIPDFPIVVISILTPIAGVIGLMVPGFALDWFRARMRLRYRNAFPEFTDLTVVCIESGQSLTGALERVSQESAQFCPELAMNLHLMNLEIRAGRTLSESLDGLYDRLGIDEVKSLGLLLKQSEELGSSIAATLRVFSDEMREKRLMRAETRAHQLPVKLTLPLGAFIFPVILLVILTPSFIRIMNSTLFNPS